VVVGDADSINRPARGARGRSRHGPLGPPLSRSSYDPRCTATATTRRGLLIAWGHACRVVAITSKSATPDRWCCAAGLSQLRQRPGRRAGARFPRHRRTTFPYFRRDRLEGPTTATNLAGPFGTFGAEDRWTSRPRWWSARSRASKQWHQRHTHCPLCGTADRRDARPGWTSATLPRRRQRPTFPRTDPAVIMLVHDGADLGAAWPRAPMG